MGVFFSVDLLHCVNIPYIQSGSSHARFLVCSWLDARETSETIY